MAKKGKLKCPKCGSTDVKRDLSNPIWGIGIATPYKCQDCGYRSFFFPKYYKEEKEE
jgi:predicted RNA-binding Zn-ribbon protein involved in translation (DUF1610 family)